MALSDLEWTRKLTETVFNALPDLFGEGAVPASHEPQPLHRRYSFMFRYQVKLPNGDSRNLLVKIPRESWMLSIDESITSENIQAWTQREFDTMNLIADIIDASDESQLFAIRPGAFFPEMGALLMEEYSLRMLKTSLSRLAIILASQKSWNEFEHQVELAGVWLRVIQGQTAAEQTKTLMTLNMEKQIENEFSALEKITGQNWAKLRKQFHKLYKSLESTDVPLAALHNDYHLGNVFVINDGRVGVLDPNWVDCGSVYEDLSSLLIDPVTRKEQVLSFGLLFRPSQYQRYERAILRGYCGDAKPSFPLIYFYCALDVVFKWRSNEEILKEDDNTLVRKMTSKLLTPVVRIYFRNLTLKYLKWGIAQLNSSGR